MAFPISKQVLLASPVPLISENSSGYLCASMENKCNWLERSFSWCVQDGRGHPPYYKQLWQLPSSLLFIFVSVLCHSLDTSSTTGPPWQNRVCVCSCRAKKQGEASAPHPNPKGFAMGEKLWHPSKSVAVIWKTWKALAMGLTRSLGSTLFSGKFLCLSSVGS